jgi:glycosyltransferase involved in cell wall biosynthesis
LNVGRIAEKKGLDVLIRAFSGVVAHVPSARLVVAGPDDEGLTSRLKVLAAGLNVADAVTFTGMLDRDEMVGALRCAAVWALPSRTENFGIAVVEAMAAGLPVVISPEVNIARELSDAGAAVVVQGTAQSFEETITALLGDEGRRRELGDHARWFARRYDWAAIGPMLLEMYERVRGGS